MRPTVAFLTGWFLSAVLFLTAGYLAIGMGLI